MRWSRQQSEFFPLTGGLNQITQPIALKPGEVIDSINYESSYKGGYERVLGYERFDGRPKPSDATFVPLPFQASAGAVSVGDTVNGQTSGATGKVIFISVDRLLVVVTKVTGAFSIGENIRVSTTVVGVYVNETRDLDVNQMYALAAQDYRTDIQTVPGSGPIRGVWRYNDVVYAFRNNAGGTACIMHKSSGSGWTAVTHFEYINVTVAAGVMAEGSTVTQGGVTATLRRVVLRTGSLGGSDGVGILVISGRSGGNFAAGAITVSGGGTATCGGAQTAIALPAGGRYEFFNHNFGGSAQTFRMYFVTGADALMYEFDGTYLVPINTGITINAKFMTVHKNHLFGMFGSSMQHSSPGDPYKWSAVFGASELALGEAGTGMVSVPGFEGGAALMAFTRNRTYTLYGNTVASWNLVPTSPDTGCIPYTMQQIFRPIFLDDVGVTVAPAAQEFGNFVASSISEKVRPSLQPLTQTVTASVVVRNKNQYRIYFENGYGFTFTFVDKKLSGIMPFQIPVTVRCISESEADGVSVYFGSDDGYVYQAERGRSFDGVPISYYVQLAFSHSKSPRMRKRYRGAVLEMIGESGGVLLFTGAFSYSQSGSAPTDPESLPYNASSAKWGLSQWGIAKWGGAGSISSPIDINGTGFNFSLRISNSTDNELPHNLQGLIVQYIPGRSERG